MIDVKDPSSSGHCFDDYLNVYDSRDSDLYLLGQFCGSQVPSNLGNAGESLLVEFVSSERAQASYDIGFRARFHTINTTEQACGDSSRPSVIDWAPGLIRSPLTETSNCHWRIRATLTKLIKMRIVTFDLPDCENCGCGGLDVYDGSTHNDPLVGRFCRGGWTEAELVFGGDSAYLEYDSYLLAPHSGFEIYYEFFDTAGL